MAGSRRAPYAPDRDGVLASHSRVIPRPYVLTLIGPRGEGSASSEPVVAAVDRRNALFAFEGAPDLIDPIRRSAPNEDLARSGSSCCSTAYGDCPLTAPSVKPRRRPNDAFNHSSAWMSPHNQACRRGRRAPRKSRMAALRDAEPARS